jgi:putative flavoprotein involved in K+ transport
VVDADTRIEGRWRGRWDSLRLFTPAGYSSLPGMPFPAPPEAYPSKDAVADYLQAYEARFELPVRLETPVVRLAAHPSGYMAETQVETILAHQVVLATGPFQRPRVPQVAHRLSEQAGDDVVQLHSSRYRRPDSLPDGPVLVVGGGNSGVQIAAELSRTHPTTLAVGRRLPYLPQRLAGRSIFWWLDHLGLMQVPTPPPIGPWWRARDFLIGCTPARLRDRGVTLAGRVVGAERGRLRCQDGSLHQPRTVVWATGFVPDNSWIDVPVIAPTAGYAKAAAAPCCPGSTRWACPGSATPARHCSAGSGGTRPTSSSTSRGTRGHTSLDRGRRRGAIKRASGATHCSPTQRAVSGHVMCGVAELGDGGDDVGGTGRGVELDDAAALFHRGLGAADAGQVGQDVVDEQCAAGAVHALDPERVDGGGHVFSSGLRRR